MTQSLSPTLELCAIQAEPRSCWSGLAWPGQDLTILLFQALQRIDAKCSHPGRLRDSHWRRERERELVYYNDRLLLLHSVLLWPFFFFFFLLPCAVLSYKTESRRRHVAKRKLATQSSFSRQLLFIPAVSPCFAYQPNALCTGLLGKLSAEGLYGAGLHLIRISDKIFKCWGIGISSSRFTPLSVSSSRFFFFLRQHLSRSPPTQHIFCSEWKREMSWFPFDTNQFRTITRKVSRAWEREREENKRQSNVKCCAAASAWRAFHTLIFVYLFETLSLGNSWWRRKRELEKREKRNERENNEETWRSRIYCLYRWWLHPSVFLVVPLCVVRSLTFSHSSTSLYGKCDVVVFGE